MAQLLRFVPQLTTAPQPADVETPEATLLYLQRLHESITRESRTLRTHLNDFFTGSRTILSGSLEVRYKHVSANYTTEDEVIIGVDTSGGARTITLSQTDAKKGRLLFIKDESGNAATNNITVSPDGGLLIDGAASFIMNTDYQSSYIYSDGGKGVSDPTVRWYTATLSSSTITALVTGEFDFHWPHIIGTDEQLILGGVDIGRGVDATVIGLEVYFETPPTTAATLQVMNGSNDTSSTATLALGTTSYSRTFALTKSITTGNPPDTTKGLFVRFNGAPDGAEFLSYGRIIYTIP